MDAKPVSASRTLISAVALPRDANQYGFVFGGTVMGMVDQAAYTAAVRHARMAVVTVSVDHMTFLKPVHIGDVILVQASVNCAWRTSLEVGVKIEAERVSTGVVEHVGSAYLTMVALDEAGAPTPVPPVLPEDDEDRRRMAGAQERRRARLELVGRTCTEQAHG